MKGLFKKLGTGMVMGLALLASQGASAQTAFKVQVYPGNITSLFAYMGVELGYYKKHGLDVELVNISTGPQANAALAGGSVDVIMTTPDNMLLFKSRGFDPVAVMGNAKEPVMRLVGHPAKTSVAPGADYKTAMQSLKGKTVGVYGLGSAAHRYVQLLARDAGLKPDELKYTGVSGGGQSLAGLQTGSMDAVTEVFASVIMIEQLGQGKLLLDCATQECPAWATETGRMSQAWWTTRSFLEKNPAAMQAYIKAHREIDQWIRDPANRDALVAALKKIYPVPQGLEADTYFKAVAEKVPGYFTVATYPKAIADTQAIMLETGELKTPVDTAAMVWDQAAAD
ncbi:ABC transporter substrate-binding protein [Pusillimonas sp. NJUB218]|uniref:ABC transporter substrate-binding protein n=1 Tax=Pusillimonas sp. NJUB218 TaxID=2023230 RepID=UPI000F4CC7F6|nr:ABC transporter substrate-binding protein [Pusillimonas sp. NJUB218]ROT46717.1 hypothetical protein CHR62_02000 [Pusillimonas sp. NJUB218]